MRNVDTCLTNALAVSGSNGNDEALLAVLGLFFSYAQAQLNL